MNKVINFFERVVSTIKLCDNWLALLMNKFVEKLVRLVSIPLKSIKLRSGETFVLKGGKVNTDLSIIKEIWSDKVYNPPFFHIGPSDVVFDVGANKGYFTIMAGNAAKKGKVYSFEPVPELFDLLCGNIKANNLANVKAFPIALSNTTGKMNFYMSKTHNAMHSVFPSNAATETITVEAADLENFCHQNQIEKIDFLKMDCEGSEYDILMSLNPETLKKIKKISMEYHTNGSHSVKELADFLGKNNFIVNVSDSGYLYAINLI